MPELNLNADALFHEVHLGGRISGHLEDLRLSQPTASDKQLIQDSIELRARQRGDVDAGIMRTSSISCLRTSLLLRTCSAKRNE